MQPQRFTFRIEAEPRDTVLTRVLTALSRRRIQLVSFYACATQGDLLHITFTIIEGTGNAERLAAQLAKQIDILSITYSERKNDHHAKPNLQRAL